MSEWITDRLPNSADMDYVYGADGKIKVSYNVLKGEAWKPIPEVEPYAKPKRCKLSYDNRAECYAINVGNVWKVVLHGLYYIPGHREAAERITAIYEEMYP